MDMVVVGGIRLRKSVETEYSDCRYDISMLGGKKKKRKLDGKDDEIELWMFAMPKDFHAQLLDGSSIKFKLKNKAGGKAATLVGGDNTSYPVYLCGDQTESGQMMSLFPDAEKDQLSLGKRFDKQFVITRSYDVPECDYGELVRVQKKILPVEGLERNSFRPMGEAEETPVAKRKTLLPEVVVEDKKENKKEKGKKSEKKDKKDKKKKSEKKDKKRKKKKGE
eukprot:TRINITY_DN876_c0_g1_i6.p1 TRINITY_DN876_c0_g1~~TRINITY_DN876_c0_g1_i6.p1  ORF type:complete len:222 (+),score=84.87 TRINITY_DN876_c0_g1_i6:953-1618(+)